jgi:hypothetical protein
MRAFLWLGGEKVIGTLIYQNINTPYLYIAVLEQKPTFPSYKYFNVGDYVIVKNNRGQFVVLRKMDVPITNISNEWIKVV